MAGKKKIYILINFIILFIVFVEYNFFIEYNEFHIKILEAQLFLLYLFSIVYAYYLTKDWLNEYILFLGSFLIFLLGRPFIKFFNLQKMNGYDEYLWFKEIENFTFSNQIYSGILFYLIIAIIFLNLGYFFSKSIKKEIIYKITIDRKIGYIFFFIGGICFLIRSYIYAMAIVKYGYSYIYTGSIRIPFLIRIFDDFFYIGYLILILNLSKKRYVYILSCIFVIMYATVLLAGQRGEFFIILLTIIWFLNKRYVWNFKLYKLILLSIILLIIIQLGANIKYGKLTLYGMSVVAILQSVFYSQGVSILVLGYVFYANGILLTNGYGIKYLSSPLLVPLFSLIGEYEIREKMNAFKSGSLGEALQYILDKNGYYEGYGTGSNFLAELYLVGNGIFFCIIGCFVIGYSLRILTEKIMLKKNGVFLVMMTLPTFFWISRGSFLQPFTKFIFSNIILMILILLQKIMGVSNKK